MMEQGTVAGVIVLHLVAEPKWRRRKQRLQNEAEQATPADPTT